MAASIKNLLMEARKRLSTVETPELDAEILLAYVLQKPRSFLHTWPQKILNDAEISAYFSLLKRRQSGEPVAYLVGNKDFFAINLQVDANVLIPRPETELIVEAILALDLPEQHIRFADLGTGSGAIALSIANACPHWEIHAVDISENALTIAKKNAQILQISNVTFHQGSWLAALRIADFNVIAANPPYLSEVEWPDFKERLRYEPKLALVSGDDGLVAIREIVKTAPDYLVSGGHLLLEHGYCQGAAVREILNQQSFSEIKTLRDLSGHERLTMGKSS